MGITKGEWVVIDNGNRVMLKAVGEPQIICTLETRPLEITPEVQADARLIAAAPEMLKALKEVAATFIGLVEGSIGGQAMKKVKAAIALAEKTE